MNLDFNTPWQQLQGMLDGFLASLPRLILSLIIFAVFFFLARVVKRGVTRLSRQARMPQNAAIVLGRLSQWVAVLLGLLVSLSIAVPTFRAGDLVQLLGITSVAIGFAFRDILQNFLAGIILLISQPFRIDDQIIVSGYEGTVEDIQTRATLIRTYDGRRVVIPNSTVFMEAVTVNTAFEVRRSEYDIGIGYGDDVDLARSLILDAVKSVKGVLRKPAVETLVVELDASTVNIRVWWWTESIRVDVLRVQSDVIKEIKRQLTLNGIDLPFPTQQILFHDQTEETDGDRDRQREGWPAGQSPPPETRRISDSLRMLGQRRFASRVDKE